MVRTLFSEAFGAPPAYYTSCQMEQVVPISQMNKFDVPCKVTPGPTVDVTQEGFQWSSRIFYMSMCSTLCCGFFGMIATAWSILAYVDSRVSRENLGSQGAKGSGVQGAGNQGGRYLGKQSWQYSGGVHAGGGLSRYGSNKKCSVNVNA